MEKREPSYAVGGNVNWCSHYGEHYRGLLGCTPQAYEACACPASRLNKQPWVSNRDINGLMNGGAYTSEARSWSDTPPPCAADSRQDVAVVFTRGGKWRGLPVIGNWCQVGLLVFRQNQQRGTPLTAPLIRTVTSWGLGQVPRKVSQVGKIQEKQALVGQGMYREQENSHLEWPDHTLHYYIPCTTLTILVHLSSAISLGSGM